MAATAVIVSDVGVRTTKQQQVIRSKSTFSVKVSLVFIVKYEVYTYIYIYLYYY